MSSIISKIYDIPNLYKLTGCNENQIKVAQKELDLIFPEEYVKYVKEFGAISFYGTEWTGLNVDGYLNVVEATKQEISVNRNFPKKCFVIENIGIDAKVVIVNEKGNVFILQKDEKKHLCESISEYLDICIKRRE